MSKDNTQAIEALVEWAYGELTQSLEYPHGSVLQYHGDTEGP